jgi:hypothetical protein
MVLRQTRRKKDGKTHSYWSVVENHRLGTGRVVQRHGPVSGRDQPVAGCGLAQIHRCFRRGRRAIADPGLQAGPAFPNQLERQVRSQTDNLGEVDAEDRMESRTGIEGRSIGLAGPLPGRAKLSGGRCGALLQPLQDCLDLLVAGQHLRLVDVIQLERLGQGENVLRPIIAGQRLAHHLNGRMAPPITVGSQDGWVALPRHDRADDGQPRHTGNVGQDMMQLQVHLHQRLLHVLDMRSCIIQQPFPLPQIGTQPRDLGLGTKTGAQ